MFSKDTHVLVVDDSLNIRRIVVDGLQRLGFSKITTAEDALEAMERVGAGVDMDLQLQCADCGHAHEARFQMQDYLLGALMADWRALVEDIHRIALAYRWSLGEILALPIRRRRAFVALLSGDAVPSAEAYA